MTLTCIAVVCRERPAIDALAHVVQLLDDLLDHSQHWSIPDAAAAGHLHLLQWLTTSTSNPVRATPVVGKKLIRKAILGAARNGHLHVLRWLRTSFALDLGRDIARGALSKAVTAGHVQAADWIDANYPEESCEAMAIVEAARSGHLPMVQWIMRRRRLEWIVAVAFSDLLAEAIAHDQLCVMQWICRWTKAPRDMDWLVAVARQHRHEEVAQWLASYEPRRRLLGSAPTTHCGGADPPNRRSVEVVANAHSPSAVLP